MERILLVEDHRSLRQGLAWLLERDPDLEVAGQVGSLAEARAALNSQRVDAALVDLTLPDGEGVELVRELRASDPPIPVLVLTISLEAATHEKARRAGANEVLSKAASINEIIGAIKRVAGL
jgi:DNA-binding NarL/FixJ family response regulator